jgi:regulator of sigma E protease
MSDWLSILPGPAQTILYFFLALFPLVLIHEFGHFAVAKLNKIRVDEFGIGFPPRLITLFKHGDTEYTINSLPLGGFVRMAGEDDPTIPGAFASRSKRARAAVLFAGPLANFILAAVILSGIALAYGVPSALPEGGGMVQVSGVLPGQPAAVAGILAGDLIYAVDGQRLVELAKPDESVELGETPAMNALRAQADTSAGKTMQVMLLRGLATVHASADALASPDLKLDPAEIALLDAQRVAAVPAGGELLVGDIVIKSLVAASDQPVVLRPTADGASPAAKAALLDYVHTLAVQPERAGPDQPGLMGVQISALSTTEEFGIGKALVYGPQQAMLISGAMVKGLFDMITGAIAPAIAGPVGIAKLGKQAGEQGADTFLFFMALLSINLGIINLLPIPALDGGRLMFIGFEALRGRRMEPTREAVVHLIGFALVLGLMAVITVWEVAKLGNLTLP